MRITRTLNVLTLTVLLILTGCFGLVDDGVIPPSEGESNTSTTINNPPQVTSSVILNSLTSESAEPQYNADDELTGFEFNLYYAAIDLDGDSMVMGWDTDLDGQIDVNVSQSFGQAQNYGFTHFDMPLTAMNELNGFDMDDTYHLIVAFIAIDEHGLGTAEFVEAYFIAPDSLADDNNDGNLALYAVSGKDAQGTPGTGTTDNLIMLTMDQGGDINWASISVKLSIDGAAPVTCANPGTESNGVCTLVEFGTTDDQVWSVGDGVTVVEDGQDLCNNACSIDVTITDTREGKTIDTTNNVPAE